MIETSPLHRRQLVTRRAVSVLAALAGFAVSLAIGGCSATVGTRPPGPAGASGAQPAGLGSALVGSAPAGQGPSEIALNPATHTIYVANGNNDNGPNAGGNTISVIDSRHCQAADVSRCAGPWPTIKVGDLPSTIAVDQRTDTVYVTDSGDNAVSVFNGATCNAVDSSGCGQKPATVPVGLGPLGIFADQANHTVYIANANNGQNGGTTVSMLDSATCNASHLAACPTHAPPIVDVGATPQDVTVDAGTHTVYVTTMGALNGWAVFNATTCNATVQAGCTAIGRLAGDSSGPISAQVDPANDTLQANFDNTVSAFDLRDCDAADLRAAPRSSPAPSRRYRRKASSMTCRWPSMSACTASTSLSRKTTRWSSSTPTCATGVTGRSAPRCARPPSTPAPTPSPSSWTSGPRPSTPSTRPTTTSPS